MRNNKYYLSLLLIITICLPFKNAKSIFIATISCHWRAIVNRIIWPFELKALRGTAFLLSFVLNLIEMISLIRKNSLQTRILYTFSCNMFYRMSAIGLGYEQKRGSLLSIRYFKSGNKSPIIRKFYHTYK